MLTQQQKTDRLQGVGGSDVSIILGLSSFKTPYELYLEKTGQAELDTEETPQQYWGNVLEPVIVQEFIKRNQVIVEFPDTIVHPFYDFMRANVDGYIPSLNAVLEAKSSSAFMSSQWGEDGSDVIPMSYLVQVAHYVSCMNATEARIALLLGGNDYREFIYTRDYELEQTVIEACKNFWHCVQNNIEPELINIDDLKLKYPRETPGESIIAHGDILELMPKLSENKQQQKQLKEIENDFRFKIIEHMKSAECLTDGDGKPLATYKTNKRGTRTLLLKGV